MKHRILLNGNQVEELENPVTITIYTKCPEKWILLDTETGEKYRGSNKKMDLDLLNKRKKQSHYVIWDKMV
jgi:phosphoribosylanthranilate isomerase